MKKIIIGFLSILCVMSLYAIQYVDVCANTDDDSAYVVDRTTPQMNYFMGGGTVYKQAAKTYYAGILDSSKANYGLKPQTYQWIDVPAMSEDVKVVTWSQGTKDSFKASTTRATARDFEEKNPGWIVVAGGNGDWFRINDTCEAVNTMVQNGEVVRPFAQNSPDLQVIGWNEDKEHIVGIPTLDSFMTAHIYTDKEAYDADFKNEIESLRITSYNTTPSETGITLLTKDMANAVDLTGYTVYVGEYELCRVVYDTRAPFVKGTIKKVVDNLTLDKPQQARENTVVREFYLVSKDGSLEQKLQPENYVKCQFDLNGAWENVTSACGYINKILDNYVPQFREGNEQYGLYDEKTAVKPRMLIGFKEDGSIVMMDVDGRAEMQGRTGLSCFEAGELMRLAGCKEAYNLDGGGSATLIVRNQYGDFDIVNTPSDGSERSIGNAILFVMRDPGLKWDMAETTRNAIAIKKDETNISEQLQDVKVTINGITKTMEGNQFLFEGLEEDTEYDVLVTYKVPSEKDPTKLLNGSFRTKAKTAAFLMPNSGIVFEQINKTSVKVVKKPNVYASWFQDVVISMGGNEYIMGNENELLIEDLISDTEYDVTITYNVVEEGTGNVYPGSETKTLKTLSYELPTITAFNVVREYSNKIIIKCEYKDPDKKVKKAVLYVNEEEIILKTTSGNQTITDLDFEANEYTFQMVLTYEVGIGRVEKVSSEKIEYKHEGQTKHNITYQLDGGTNEEGAPVEYTEGIGIASLPVPTKEGYRFLGWYKGETKVESISKEETTDITLTAKWESTTMNEPKPKGCKCKKSSMEYIVTLTTTLSLAIFLFRKKK